MVGFYKIEYPEIENIPEFWVQAISAGDALRQAKRITAIRIAPKASLVPVRSGVEIK